MIRKRLLVSAAAAGLVAALACRPACGAASVERLRCEHATDPVGIGETAPRLGWIMTSDARGDVQTACQILVASSERELARDRGDLWDSGKVRSDRSINVAYAGRPLGSRARAWWKVRVWDSKGKPSGWSAPATFETGLLEKSDWKAEWIGSLFDEDASPMGGAKWIWFPEGNPAQGAPVGDRFFRRAFEAPAGAKVESAKLVLTVDDRFVLYVNGKEVAKSGGKDAWRTPVTVDLKDKLADGRNTLAVVATNDGAPAGFIGKLVVKLAGRDGVTVATDRAWKAFAERRGGWEAPRFDDSAWRDAMEVADLGGGPWGNVGSSGTGRVPPFMRKGFRLAKPVKSARVYASALGLYELYLNGKRVGNHVFAPGWTDYRRRVQYQTWDVTDMLRRGENAVGAILGDGWYAGHVGLGGPNRYGSFPVFMCQLDVVHEDGTRETVVTDESWKASRGPIIAGDLLMGETYDARKEIPGWAEPGFRDAEWLAATAREVTVPLEAERGPPVRRLIELDAKKIAEPSPGAYVFDMGQNMVGWVRISVDGPEGTEVQLRFAEMLNPNGTMYTTNLRGAKNIDRYIKKGAARETWEPRFTFHGFRYVELTGLPRRPSLDAVKGIVVYSDIPRTGTFECSHAGLNQLQQNIEWGQRGNYLSVPTDCPQRDERLGWTGDAQVFVRTAAYNMDVAGFFKKWLVDLDDAQGGGGDYPDVAPRVAAGGGTAAWGDAGTICPWSVYVAYGDERFLADHFDGMRKWVEYCRANSNGLIRPNAGYGDWLSMGEGTPKDVISTAYFAHSTDLTARAARVLGKGAEAERLEKLFDDIKRAFNERFVKPDGRIHGNSQSCYLMALNFDLLPEALRPKAAEYLVERVQSRNWHLSTGFVGVSMLLPVLTRYGRTDVAWRLLETDTFPSWLFSVKHGATTIWERWDGWTPERGFQDPGMNSFNHYSLGSCGEWMYGTAAGIAPDPAKPGYKHIVIRPRPGGTVTWIKSSLESVHGRIATHWRLAGGRLELDVTIPANTTATVYVPARAEGDVKEGGKAASRAEGVKFLRMEDGSAIFEVGSGDYKFSSRAP